MPTSLLNIYHSLPPFGRNAAASLHGYRLRAWRYGPETEALVRQARDREHWEPRRWRAWQDRRLAALLERAVAKVPYYLEIWKEQKPVSDKTESGKRKAETGFNSQPSTLNYPAAHRAEGAWESLQNWPVLRKTVLRERPQAFVANDPSRGQLHEEHTSGTSGTPLRLWHSRAVARQWYALMEARWRGWYGISREDRWAILGGQLITPVAQTRPPFWVWNTPLNQLYLSSYHLKPENVAAYLSALRSHRVVYLWGYASSLYSLARFAEDQRIEAPQLKVVVSNAELLYSHQRKLIAQVFQCAVRDTYGMSEMVCAASECEAGRMHLWPEVGVYEVLRDEVDEPVPEGETGRLVCTGLLNDDMPLIRYEVGDRVAIAPPDTSCPCGRTLPILLSVDGRNDDVIVTRDGRRVGRLDPVFKSDFPIREAQVLQESMDLIRVKLVPGTGFNSAHEQELIAAMRERIGEVVVQIERVSSIPRSASGKFRAVISNVERSKAVQVNEPNQDYVIHN